MTAVYGSRTLMGNYVEERRQQGFNRRECVLVPELKIPVYEATSRVEFSARGPAPECLPPRLINRYNVVHLQTDRYNTLLRGELSSSSAVFICEWGHSI